MVELKDGDIRYEGICDESVLRDLGTIAQHYATTGRFSPDEEPTAEQLAGWLGDQPGWAAYWIGHQPIQYVWEHIETGSTVKLLKDGSTMPAVKAIARLDQKDVGQFVKTLLRWPRPPKPLPTHERRIPK